MTLADFPQLKRLPPRQRLNLAEALWDSAVSDALPVPASHKRLIRARRAAYARGEVATLTMAELRQSLRRRQ
jgi:putative addiction module component (TIGR02574 family)